MTTDIRLKLSYRNHPKTKKLALKLGPVAPLNFIYLLMFAAESKSDGRLTDMDHEDIALAADFAGDPSEWVETLLALRLLDQDGGVLVIHDWEDNNPWAAGAKERSAKAKKAAKARWSTENQSLSTKKDAPSMDEHCGEHESAMRVLKKGNAPSPSPSPSPLPTQEDQDQEQAAFAASLRDSFWAVAERVLGDQFEAKRSVCGMLVNACGGDYFIALNEIETAEGKDDPVSWIAAKANKRHENQMKGNEWKAEMRRLAKEAEARHAGK